MISSTMTFFLPHLRQHWRQYLTLVAFAGMGISFIFVTGLHQELTFDTLALRSAAFTQAIEDTPVRSILFGLGFYVAFVVFAVPGIWLLGVAYGLLFGWVLGLPLILLGTVIGATILYAAARSAFARHFRTRLGPILARLAEGFRKDAANYLLLLRFAPMFPFVIVNVTPGLLGVPYRTFLWTTMVGITPASIAYVYVGEGLRTLVEERVQACIEDVAPCGEALSLLDILNPQVLFAFALLAVLAVVPVLMRNWRSR